MRDQLGDKQRLEHIVESLNKIVEFTKGLDESYYLVSAMVQSAVERQLEIIGEAVAALSLILKENYPEVEWNKIKSFRNVIAHEYFGVSQKQVWNVVIYEIPKLRSSIERILRDLSHKLNS